VWKLQLHGTGSYAIRLDIFTAQEWHRAMDFRFDEEQSALRDAIRAFCQQHFALTEVASRAARPAAPTTWRALGEMGVFDMLVPAERGGFGGGAVEAAIVFEQFGAHLATGPLLWSTIGAPLLSDGAEDPIRVVGTVLVAGPRVPYVVEHAAESDVLLVVHEDRVERCATTALTEPVDGEPLDPLTPTLAFLELPRGVPVGGPDDVARLRRLGTILAAAELVGVAQGALDVASAYALERHQFGVPIGSFQAVKHMLADMYVRVELARSATYAAAAVCDDERAGDATTAASAAKLLAGDAGIANGRTAVQVLGGMGFTWEMTPHYFLKRAWAREESFGTGDAHALALSAALEWDVRGTVTAWT
jgi:alkylation response protein AidB-like acyl-CoA dehydrogenase